jgi:NADH-quinone oxidoreductase subunit C
MTAASVLDVLRDAAADAAYDEAASSDMPTIYVDREHVVDVCRVLRDHPDLQFALLLDVTAADYTPAEPRFEVVYHFACVGEAFKTVASGPAAPARRLRVKVRVPGEDARLPTISSVYPSAGWPEREVFDLFGIVFERHPDLRRILMPEDWQGYPMRRDSPVQIRKDTQVWEPIQITAEEFAANVRAARERAQQDARPEPGRPDHE